MSTSPIAAIQPLLQGLRVLELGHFVAAPFASRVMADMGADVIKIEPPGAGDAVRTWGRQVNGQSIFWSVLGRNKRSVSVNLREAAGRAIVLELARHCEVVIENFRAGQLEKWGLGPDALNEVRPGIVVVRISGYGQTGPEAARSGFGVIGEAKGGIRFLTGYPKEVSELPPVRAGVSFGDSVSGLYGALGALAAVLHQRSTNARTPRVIDVALGESVVSLLDGCLPEYSVTGEVRQPMGSGIALAAPTNAYPCQGGDWLLIAANSDRLWAALADVMGQPVLATDPRFIDNPSRVRNVAAIDRLISDWTRTLPIDKALAMVEARDIPATKIYSIADVAEDRQYRARGMVTSVNDPAFGPVLHPGVVPVVAGLDRGAQIRWPGPAVGAHTDEVLSSLLGYDAGRLTDLKKRGLI